MALQLTTQNIFLWIMKPLKNHQFDLGIFLLTLHHPHALEVTLPSFPSDSLKLPLPVPLHPPGGSEGQLKSPCVPIVLILRLLLYLQKERLTAPSS